MATREVGEETKTLLFVFQERYCVVFTMRGVVWPQIPLSSGFGAFKDIQAIVTYGG